MTFYDVYSGLPVPTAGLLEQATFKRRLRRTDLLRVDAGEHQEPTAAERWRQLSLIIGR